LKKIFKKYRIVRNPDFGIDHSEIRTTFEQGQTWTQSPINQKKIDKVSRAYQLVRKSVDEDVDYYWIIEDDNIFPLNTYDRYWGFMTAVDCDVVCGMSYSWNIPNTLPMPHNFWNIATKRVFPDNDSCNDVTYVVTMVPYQTKGIYLMGASGLVNVFMKKKCMMAWLPHSIPHIGSAADCSFWINAKKNEFVGYGLWEVRLPHITKYANDDIQIVGRIDKSLIPLVTKNMQGL